EDLVVGTGVLGIREVVEQLVVLTRGEGRVEREVRLRDRERLRHLLLGAVHPLGDLFDGRLAAELLQERGRALADPVQRAGPVQRHPHDARLLGPRLENRLPDPPDRIGDELDALGLVELVGGADQAKVALVDQVQSDTPWFWYFLATETTKRR